MRLVLIGLVAGFFSALFGVGGGIVIVPLLLLLCSWQAQTATATSLAAIGITAGGFFGSLITAIIGAAALIAALQAAKRSGLFAT